MNCYFCQRNIKEIDFKNKRKPVFALNIREDCQKPLKGRGILVCFLIPQNKRSKK